MIETVEEFFSLGCGRCKRFATPDCSALRWADGLAALRRICLEAGLSETVKWGHPCYRHAGRNVAIIGTTRGDFRISFFRAALMKDPAGILEKPGPNTRHPDTVRFTSNDGPAEMAPVIQLYLKEAMGHAEAGTRPPKQEAAFDLPDELNAALDSDPALAAAFRTLTPGRQRSYAILLGSIKTPATRTARIVRLRPKILAGKGATER